ncbi:hypothetical protein GCM10025864_28260 [Luteimicrobium album]|uniref:Uncharacterized protein n=1 Tax=Luteimicrobium album TaxID=1054550 RepID=A0ABQ6I4C4_9MICO|nr:hypothetical protein [Luteimicrobium album]GMA25067.1 hypothetical protein GCM10025864_28260 [Luteimicrobium album]
MQRGDATLGGPLDVGQRVVPDVQERVRRDPEVAQDDVEELATRLGRVRVGGREDERGLDGQERPDEVEQLGRGVEGVRHEADAPAQALREQHQRHPEGARGQELLLERDLRGEERLAVRRAAEQARGLLGHGLHRVLVALGTRGAVGGAERLHRGVARVAEPRHRGQVGRELAVEDAHQVRRARDGSHDERVEHVEGDVGRDRGAERPERLGQARRHSPADAVHRRQQGVLGRGRHRVDLALQHGPRVHAGVDGRQPVDARDPVAQGQVVRELPGAFRAQARGHPEPEVDVH